MPVSLSGPADMDEDTGKLFRIRKTLVKMLNDRGYIVTTADMNMTLDNFKEKYGEAPQ